MRYRREARLRVVGLRRMRGVDQFAGDLEDRFVVVLRQLAQQREGVVGIDREPLHQHALGLAEEVARGQGGAELLFALGGDHRDRGMGGDRGADADRGVVEGVRGGAVQVQCPEVVLGGVELERQHRTAAQLRGAGRELRPPVLAVHVVDQHGFVLPNGPDTGPSCRSSTRLGSSQVGARDSKRLPRVIKVMSAGSAPGISSTVARVMTSRVAPRSACSVRI